MSRLPPTVKRPVTSGHYRWWGAVRGEEWVVTYNDIFYGRLSFYGQPERWLRYRRWTP